jgi:hypothetical protein
MLETFIGITIDVTRVFLPLILLFLLAQVIFIKLSRPAAVKITAGLIIAFAGLILFLFGVHIGLLPAGKMLGEKLGSFTDLWVLIPLGFVLGFVSTFGEPAVRILSDKIEDVSSGYIRKRLILYTISLGVAFFVALGMAKIVFGIPILFIIIPGYLIALIIMWFSDRTFIAIAFDAGGVATGPMAVTFLMAVAVGIATAMQERDPMLDGFGLIALIALAPIIFVLVLGIIYRLKTRLYSGDERKNVAGSKPVTDNHDH